jgi:N-acetylglucosamine kinase-like BadF-type ATPase
MLVIGVDGGGTKTMGALMDGSRKVLATAAAGASNPHTVGLDSVRATLAELFASLCRQAHVTLGDVECVALSMAGVDRPKDKADIEGIATPMLRPGAKLLVVNDAIAGIMAGLDRPHGLMLISGTGSICYGFDDDTGKTARSGGWGHWLSDEGSGYTMGLAALKAVIQAYDGRGEATMLTDLIVPATGGTVPTDVVGWVIANRCDKAEVAALSRLLHEADSAGDRVASRIMDDEADWLMKMVPPVYRALFAERKAAVPIVFGGSNLAKGAKFQARIRERIAASGLPLEPTLQKREPVEGAALYALHKATHP